MPKIPTGVIVLGFLLLVPLMSSFTFMWLLIVQEQSHLTIYQLREYVALFQFCFGLLFLLSVPTLIAFWTQHPERWSIAFVSYLTGWTVIPYLCCMMWALRHEGKMSRLKIPPPMIPSMAQEISSLDKIPKLRR